MDILLHLASQAGKVVDTNELIERNWPANKGSDNTLYKVISELRRALDDKDRSARKIESVAKRGYRLTLTVKRDLAESSVGHTSNHQQLLKESLEQGKGRLATRNYTLAARHFNVALDLCLREKDVDKNLLAELYLLIGDCVLQEQGKDSAESYFIQARDIALEVENHTDYARALLGLSGNLQPIITGAAKSLANQLQLAYLAIPKTEKSLALRL
jgi:DNA-binding winged helix-turn-helix (wHTH) protein